MISKALKTLSTTLFILFFCLHLSLYAEDTLFLRENLKKAKTGDYLVTLQDKTFTLFRIGKIEPNSLIIEEISVPKGTFLQQNCFFRDWFKNEALGASSRSMYEVDLNNGGILKSYTFLNGQWYEKAISNPFLSTLLNIRLNQIPPSERKKIGLSSTPWQPLLKFEGQTMLNVPFYAWRTKWPNDNSDLSGKTIEIYTPEDSDLYPAYLPYWLEVKGIGGSKIRIIDSGRNLI